MNDLQNGVLSVKKAMSNADLQASHNLKVLWATFKTESIRASGEAMTQRKIAALMGWSQSNFSQYLNGIVPIGRKAAQTMADVFGCSASDIRPDYTDAQVIEENEKLKSMLSEVLDILSQLRNGRTDLHNVDLVVQSVETRAPNLIGLTG